MKEPILALLYDFDNTLASSDMQNFTFIPKVLHMEPSEFWNLTNEIFKKWDMDKVLCYMYCMVNICKEKGIKLTRSLLNDCGKDIKFFEGVTTWFDRINEYGAKNNVKIEHYIISCGNLEIIEGSSIFHHFKRVFGCEFIYDDEGNAIWPKTAINYTGKTQYIYRIKKGIIDGNDDIKINQKIDEKKVPIDNMIYFGDGLTDVPAMITVKDGGGTSIAVYPKGKREKVTKYYEDGRVNYICKADFSKNSELEKIVKLLIEQTHVKASLEERKKNL